MLDVAVNGLPLKLPKWHRRSTGELPIWNSSRLMHATDKVNYVISDETAVDANGAVSTVTREPFGFDLPS